MPEAEIGKSGEVVIEGHVLGRLDGFTFAADASAGGSEAKALQAAAQKALAGEIEARATRLTQAPDTQIVLASDGAIRWLGEVVGKLIAGDDVLRARVRIVADEHLTGASRDAVQARLDLWLKAHLEKVLAPLFALNGANDVTGMARGVAYQLLEELGVLERSKVAEDVKGLDQASRATLRKYGVRFGAYHIYMPLLLKPAARALAAQLAALKHPEFSTDGVGDVQHLAASGRTSMPANKEVPKALYRVIGYRVCGERAVRVDILERLADLVRAALTWRPGAPGPKPPGAFDGSGFVVSGPMTSLIGASGEDFASVLRSLGYRMDRRPKPVEPEAPPAASVPDEAAAPAETEAVDVAEADAPATAPDAELAASESTQGPQQEAQEESQPEASAPVEAAPSEPTAVAPTVIAPTPVEPTAVEAAAPEVAAPEASTAEATAPEAVTAEPAAPAEPEMIEVWRPGRRSDDRPREQRAPRRPQRRGPRPDQAAAPQAAADGTAAPSAEASASATPGSGEERQHRRGRRPDRPEQGERQARGDRPPQGDRPRGDRPPFGQRPPRGERPQRGDRPPRGDRPSRDERPSREDRRSFFSSQPRQGRDKAPDPNSPFAKLAALKEQLEAANKEPR